MSTAKIREALALLSDGPDSDAARTANAALRDVDAIEKAAKDFVNGDTRLAVEAMKVFNAIASEAAQ